MNRLQHTKAGFLRYMQMSEKKLFVFVEGKQMDPYFYGKICSDVASNNNISYEICSSRELPESTGGKQSLLKYFRYLRRVKSLKSDLLGKLTVCFFFVDKDIDDINRRCIRSNYLVYTKFYEVENHIFENCDLKKALAAAASIDPQLLSSSYDNASTWCKIAANKWKKWVKLCLFVNKEKINAETNYGVLSKINIPLSDNVDVGKLNQLISVLKIKLNIDEVSFKEKINRVAKRIDLYYSRGEHHKLFKGKWFIYILCDEIGQQISQYNYDSNRLVVKLPNVLLSTLNFDDEWTSHFKDPLLKII
jgi:hypothetical protein